MEQHVRNAGGFSESPKTRAEDNPSLETPEYQDVISQFPFLNGYTHICFGFRLSSDHLRDAVISTLRKAVMELTVKIPWLGGQVIQVNSSIYNNQSLTAKLADWPLDSPANEIIRINYCENTMPSIAQLVQTGAPVNVLVPEALTPWPCLPQPHGITGPVPVVALQLNFIRGGVIMTMTCHHNIMDGTGIMQLTSLLARVLTDSEIPASELNEANRDRSRIVSLIPQGEPIKDFSHLRRPLNFMHPTPSSPVRWCYYSIPVAAIIRLRRLANSSTAMEASTDTTLLSDNDILSAFLWKTISSVRIARGAPSINANTTTKCNRAIDGRITLGVPLTYMGHLVVRHLDGYLYAGNFRHVRTVYKELI